LAQSFQDLLIIIIINIIIIIINIVNNIWWLTGTYLSMGNKDEHCGKEFITTAAHKIFDLQ
jgi:hypothetical protein